MAMYARKTSCFWLGKMNKFSNGMWSSSARRDGLVAGLAPLGLSRGQAIAKDDAPPESFEREPVLRQ